MKNPQWIMSKDHNQVCIWVRLFLIIFSLLLMLESIFHGTIPS